MWGASWSSSISSTFYSLSNCHWEVFDPPMSPVGQLCSQESKCDCVGQLPGVNVRNSVNVKQGLPGKKWAGARLWVMLPTSCKPCTDVCVIVNRSISERMLFFSPIRGICLKVITFNYHTLSWITLIATHCLHLTYFCTWTRLDWALDTQPTPHTHARTDAQRGKPIIEI